MCRYIVVIISLLYSLIIYLISSIINVFVFVQVLNVLRSMLINIGHDCCDVLRLYYNISLIDVIIFAFQVYVLC